MLGGWEWYWFMGQMNSPLSGSILATSLWQASIRTGRPEALNSDAPAGSNAWSDRGKRSLKELAEARLAEPSAGPWGCLHSVTFFASPQLSIFTPSKPMSVNHLTSSS